MSRAARWVAMCRALGFSWRLPGGPSSGAGGSRRTRREREGSSSRHCFMARRSACRSVSWTRSSPAAQALSMALLCDREGAPLVAHAMLDCHSHWTPAAAAEGQQQHGLRSVLRLVPPASAQSVGAGIGAGVGVEVAAGDRAQVRRHGGGATRAGDPLLDEGDAIGGQRSGARHLVFGLTSITLLQARSSSQQISLPLVLVNACPLESTAPDPVRCQG